MQRTSFTGNQSAHKVWWMRCCQRQTAANKVYWKEKRSMKTSMTKEQEALKLALEAAYLSGFNASGEGYNGEYPFGDRSERPEQDNNWCAKRDDFIKQVCAAPVQELVAWIDLLKQAEEIVRSNSLWKKYIDGTPLANDITVWMADFAQEHSTLQQRPWVGLTDAEIQKCYSEAYKITHGRRLEASFARAIETKLKNKNT